MEPLHLSNLAWSFANVSRWDEFDLSPVGIRHERLFQGIAAASARCVHEMVPQHHASLLWAFGACQVADGLGGLAETVASRRGTQVM